MIRGVNKQIIEVSETGSRFFERAMLFVRPEFMAADQEKLKKEAKRYIASFGQPPSLSQSPQKGRARHSGKRRFHRFLVPALCGAALLIVCLLILSALY